MRIQVLRDLMGGKTQKEFADQHNLDASYLSQLLNGHRSLGEKAAANLEAKIGLPKGTLTVPRGLAHNGTAADVADRGRNRRPFQR